MAGVKHRNTHNFKRLAKNLRMQGGPCWLCGQPIDYRAGSDSNESFSVDHAVPWSKDETLREDPGNLRAAHLGCNRKRGNRQAPAGLGLLSRDW